MAFSNDVLGYDEQAVMSLRALYRQYGYSQYEMSRFEEYGLYSDNKLFLPSGEIITFTGAGGKLMALRPDVTLSIVKNTKDSDGLKKLYYNENIYRSDGYEFKEQMQAGLECIGELDVYSIGEVIMLAGRSLEILSRLYADGAGPGGAASCIDVSHMGFISGLLQNEGLAPAQKTGLLKCISEKNAPDISSLCSQYGLGNDFRERLVALSALYGPYKEILAELRWLSVNEETDSALREIGMLQSILHELGADSGVNLDFTIVNEISYYNGIIFQGFIEGIPTKVLSGGRYDTLLRKFGKRSGAVGFAINLDLLESLHPPRGGTEVDVLIIYGEKTDPDSVARTAAGLTSSGQSVRVQRGGPGDVKYKKLIEMQRDE